jgi:hypothetical protein
MIGTGDPAIGPDDLAAGPSGQCLVDGPLDVARRRFNSDPQVIRDGPATPSPSDFPIVRDEPAVLREAPRPPKK